MPTLCVIATALVLILTAVYFCYVKPLMADGRKKRKEEAAKAEREVKRIARELEEQSHRAREQDFRKSVLSLLNELVTGSYRPEHGTVWFNSEGRRSDYPPAFEALQGLRGLREEIANLQSTRYSTSKRQNDLAGQVKEIQKVLQLGQPVEPQNVV